MKIAWGGVSSTFSPSIPRFRRGDGRLPLATTREDHFSPLNAPGPVTTAEKRINCGSMTDSETPMEPEKRLKPLHSSTSRYILPGSNANVAKRYANMQDVPLLPPVTEVTGQLHGKYQANSFSQHTTFTVLHLAGRTQSALIAVLIQDEESAGWQIASDWLVVFQSGLQITLAK